MKKESIPYMGDDTSRVFSGKYVLLANKKMYAETAEFFAQQIKKRLAEHKEYSFADIGSFQGELMAELLKELPEYKFKTIAVDINADALSKNILASETFVAGAENLPFKDKSIDIAVIRYVLAWNSPEKQKKILKELARVAKEFILVEHAGSDTFETEKWREKIANLLSGKDIEKVKRGEHFFSSQNEIEEWMKESKISFERLRSRVINNAADVFIERYGLNKTEAKKAREILADKNHLIQTDWIIFPKI